VENAAGNHMEYESFYEKSGQYLYCRKKILLYIMFIDALQLL